MTISTACRMLRDLQSIRCKTLADQRKIDVPISKLWKMVARMRPDKNHQQWDIYKMRYVDEGE